MDDKSRLARLEAKMDIIVATLDKIEKNLEKHRDSCPACREDLIDRIGQVDAKHTSLTHKLSGKVMIIITALAMAGGTVGSIIPKLFGLL